MSYKTGLKLLTLQVYILLMTSLIEINTFNVNVLNARILKDTAKGNSFGFSTALYKAPDGSLGALIGAPKANTTEGGPKSGNVFRYTNILDSNNSRGSIYHKGYINMENGTHNEGFGSTIVASDTRNILICSPRWKDTESISKTFYTFMIGRCVLQGPNINNNMTEFAPYYEKFPKLRYWTSISRTSFFYNGMATLGFSADINEKFLLFGSPGIYNSQGSVYVHDISNNSGSQMDVQLVNNLKTTSYGYLGYSVKLGKFCGVSLNWMCAAAGAPNLYSTGQVQIMTKVPQDEYIKVIQDINGTEMWSNFGYSLAVVNQINAAYDELLVGAPHYTEWKNPNHIPDQGAVYTYYYNLDTKNFQKKDIVLVGSEQSYARFGSAISDIGDINIDGFQDFAIGAPGENGGAGSVYIYLGSASGLSRSPSQRIEASQIQSQLKGFGFAISNKQIPKDTSYPVFAASSVVSEAVAVFGCKHIAEVEADLIATPNPVSTKIPCNTTSKIQGSCFQIKFCLKHKIKGNDFESLNYYIQLDIDTKIKSIGLKRALFRTDKDEQVHTVNKSHIAVTKANSPNCSVFIAILREQQINRDRFTPINIVADYRIEPSLNPANDPVLDATKANNKTIEVTFVNECGSDAKCEVDLTVNANLVYVPPDGQWDYVVVNYTKELNVKIEIKNKNDTAYGIIANIEIDSFVLFIKAKSDPSCDFKTSGVNKTDTVNVAKDKTSITCSFFEPLDSNGDIKFSLLFDTDQDNLIKNDLHIKVDVIPKNSEHNPEIFPSNNVQILNSKVFIISDITLESLSSPNEHTIYDAKRKKPSSQESDKQDNLLNVTHKILVINQGPSFLPNTEINVEIPINLEDNTQLVTQAYVKMFTPAGEVHCKSKTNTGELIDESTTTQSTTNNKETTDSNIPTTTEEIEGPIVKRKRRSAERNCQGNICFVNCKQNKRLCQVFTCELNTIIQPKSYAEINVTMVIDLSNMFVPEEIDTLKFVSQVEVKEPKHPLFKPWRVSKQQETITTFNFIQSGGEINIWIIIGSIIAGLVLITIIVIILWKVGFFKRKKHLEVQKMKRESMRRSTKERSKPEPDSEQ